ncbi:MAG: DUF2066 domain-containing protein [Proteobacteria bacterium]|nr:DUF2066 domain-containing protein [Pseudomonadota bacterium]
MFSRKLTAVMFLFVLNFATAQTVDVNQTSILVSDTVSNDSLKLRQAFAQIIAKNTGENIRDVLSNSVFNSVNIKKGVKRSYFEKIEAKYFHTRQNKLWFHLVMDDVFVQNVIQQAGFSLLPHHRKKIMLWIVTESNVEENTHQDSTSAKQPVLQVPQTILSYAYNDELTMYWIDRWSKVLGLVFVMPAMDEQDKLLVSPNSIKTLSYEAIDQSNNRYKTQQNLLVYIKNSLQNTKIRMGLTFQKDDMLIKHYQEQADEQNQIEEGEMLFSVMLEAAQQYAERNKISREDLEKHTVRILIHELENYQQVNLVRKYITSLSVIDSYDIVSASKGELVLNVNMSVSTVAFLNLIQRENTLLYDKNSPLNQLFFSLVKQHEDS